MSSTTTRLDNIKSALDGLRLHLDNEEIVNVSHHGANHLNHDPYILKILEDIYQALIDIELEVFDLQMDKEPQ